MTNLTQLTINSFEGTLFCRDFFLKESKPHWTLFPISTLCFIIASVFDAALSLLFCTASCLSLGTFMSLNIQAIQFLEGTENALKIIFAVFIKWINPNAEFGKLHTKQELHLLQKHLNPVYKQIEVYSKKTASFFQKAVLSRALYLVLIISSIVEKTFILIGGLLSGIAAACCLGRYSFLNDLAITGLNGALSLISESFKIFLKAINPRAEIEVPDLNFAFGL